jgi:hypothetical protein
MIISLGSRIWLVKPASLLCLTKKEVFHADRWLRHSSSSIHNRCSTTQLVPEPYICSAAIIRLLIRSSQHVGRQKDPQPKQLAGDRAGISIGRSVAVDTFLDRIKQRRIDQHRALLHIKDRQATCVPTAFSHEIDLHALYQKMNLRCRTQQTRTRLSDWTEIRSFVPAASTNAKRRRAAAWWRNDAVRRSSGWGQLRRCRRLAS